MPETDGTLNTAESSAAAVDFAGDVPGLGNRAEYSAATDGAAVETLNGPQRPRKEQGRYGVDIDAVLGDEPNTDPVEAKPQTQTPPADDAQADQQAEVDGDADSDRFDKHPRFQELRTQAQQAKDEAAAARQEVAQARAEIQQVNQWREQQQQAAQEAEDAQAVSAHAQRAKEDAAAELGLDPDDPDPTVQALLDRTVRSESALKKIELAQERTAQAQARLESDRVTDEAIREIRAEFPIADQTFNIPVKGLDQPLTGSIADVVKLLTANIDSQSRPIAMRSITAIIHDAADRARRDERTIYAAELAQKKETAGPIVTRAGGSESTNHTKVATPKSTSRFFNKPLNLD